MITKTTTMLHILLLILVTLLNLINGGGGADHQQPTSILQTAKRWKLFSYNFLPHAPVNDVNFYNPRNVLATGLAVDYERIFIATPQLFSGVSATVSFVKKSEFGDSPVLQAYPDWSFATAGRKDFNCSDLVLISVYRLRIDSCNRLWVLDAGISRSLEDYEITCPPKILVIDLQTDQVVRRIDFPREVLRGESLFTNLIIDETTSKTGTCDDVFVYISDTVEPAIVVYDSGRDVTWRLTHPAMFPDPDFAQSEILNHRFILMDGVVGLAFDEKKGIVYFQPLATDRVFSVTKEVLRAGPIAQLQVLQVKLIGKKSSQGIGLAVSPIDGSLLFSPLSETAIASWNPTTNQQSVLAHDRERLQFVADMTRATHEPGVIYALSSKFHRFFLKNLNTNEYNNQILRIELPGAAGSVVSAAPAIVPLAAPQLSSFALPQSQLSANYYQTNEVLPSPNFFTNSAAVLLQQQQLQRQHHPYSFEPVGIINYSLRNPFNALNQGESFPPSKQNRDLHQRSFLDTLGGVSAAAPPPPLSHGYHYARGQRSIKATELTSAETGTQRQ